MSASHELQAARVGYHGAAPVIGLEVHAQILTRSKMFCGCDAAYAGAAPNTHVCAVCAGMPGSLPVVNSRAIEGAIIAALALGCTVNARSRFDRKNYSYPDIPKGYQISQYDEPLASGGCLHFMAGDRPASCGITRLHIEEDTGKSLHTVAEGREVSLVDYNRSGVPLMEIVSEPDLASPLEAREYFAALRQVLMYLGVCDGNLQEGSMRADVNVSLRDADGRPGTKVEIKNLNSFRAVQRALEYEIERQRKVLSSGGTIVQETRGWSEADEVTVSQRTKEYAHDYRYFPEPDLPPVILPDTRIASLRETLPELPAARRARFETDYGLSPYTSRVLTDDKDLADYFEAAVHWAAGVPTAVLANWVTGDVVRLLHGAGVSPRDTKLTPENLARIVSMVHAGTISGAAGKQVLEAVFPSGEDAEGAVSRLDLRQIGSDAELRSLVDRILSENAKLVEDYRRGKTNAIQALVGKVMQASRGKANPRRATDMLREGLEAGEELSSPGQNS